MVWLVVFVITLIIGVVSFFSGEYGVWFVVLIFWVISIIGIGSSGSESTTPIESPFVSELDLQNNFTDISWREMEELTGELFRKKGYYTSEHKSLQFFKTNSNVF